MRTLFQNMHQYLAAGEDLVLATIIASSGSTPRGAGSRMLVDKNGILSGTIGGGSVEYRALRLAGELLAKKESCEHFFALNHNDVENLGMICGGDVTVFFQFLSHEDQDLLHLSETAEHLFEKHRDFWLLCDLNNPNAMAVYSAEDGWEGNIHISDSILSKLSTKPTRIRSEHMDLFSEQIGTSGTVYVFGGGHVSQQLVPALSAVGFRCVVLDDRQEFVDPTLFPDVAETILCDFEHLDRSISVTSQDYCCVMTRGHAYDTIVQAQLLATPACYIGVIGSRAKKAGVFRRLTEEFAIEEKELDRIISPIGLSIKAETPAEIAVSITAQMIQIRAERKGTI